MGLRSSTTTDKAFQHLKAPPVIRVHQNPPYKKLTWPYIRNVLPLVKTLSIKYCQIWINSTRSTSVMKIKKTWP